MKEVLTLSSTCKRVLNANRLVMAPWRPRQANRPGRIASRGWSFAMSLFFRSMDERR